MGQQILEQQQATYGAPLTTKQFIVLLIAIALGTMLEWYEFFVYAQLNPYLTKIFFPSHDPAVQQLSYWGVYAVGFIARPVGSVIFGHVGDTRGRRLNLLLTISIMAVPTVLIGCLPTFGQVGIAAPALLAVLRLIQGLAMGGEFGSAMVYLHEIAPSNMKGMVGSLGFVSAMFGCMMGVLMVVVMEAIFNPSQMLVFGWRIPFLLSSVNASAAIALRMHMPEPHEFVEDRRTVLQRNLERCPARQSSRSMDPRHSITTRLSTTGSIKSSSRIVDDSSQNDPDTTNIFSSDLFTNDASLPATEKYLDSHTVGGTTSHKTLSSPHTNALPSLPNDSDRTPPNKSTDDMTITLPATDLATVPTETRGSYVPVVRLLRHHTPAVLLQFLFEAWVSVGFWVVATWLPLTMQKAPLNMPMIITQAMLITNLVLMAFIQVAAGWLSDKGIPRVWLCFGVFTVAAGISCPVLMAMPRATIAGAWLLHTLLMLIMACVLGVVPATLSPIYPPVVRATGFNLGHNMAMSWLGGVSPTVVTALVTATGRTYLAPGVLLTVSAGVSMLAALVLVWYAPQANGNAGAKTGAAKTRG